MTCTAATNSAPSSRYSTASEAITTTSDKALLMGWLCTSRLIAPATQMAPKNRNRNRCIVKFSFFRPFGAFHFRVYPGLTPWAVIFRRFAAAIRLRPQGNNQCRHDHVGNRQRQQEFPSKGHELVIAE